MLLKLEWLGYRRWKKVWRYVKPFSSDTGTSRTDRRTDGQTELLYQYRASVCWRAIKTDGQPAWSTARNQTENVNEQEAQLSQRYCATRRVIEYFAKSLKVIWNNTAEYACVSLVFHWMYLVRFLRYLASKLPWPWNRIRVVQGHWKWRRSRSYIRLFIGQPL